MPYSKYSGTVRERGEKTRGEETRGGARGDESLGGREEKNDKKGWEEGEPIGTQSDLWTVAPRRKLVPRRDGGTGNFDTPSVRKIIGASTGGELHDQFKDYTLQEWFYEKAVRAKDIEDRKSSKQNVNRTRLVDATKDLFKSGASEVAGQVAAIPEHIGSLLGGVSNIIDEIAAAGQKKSVLNEDQLQTLRLSRRYATQGVEALMEGENALELARKKQQDAKVVQQKINKMSLKKERRSGVHE
eukprot:749826-Hanusia_phi.AAC.3